MTGTDLSPKESVRAKGDSLELTITISKKLFEKLQLIKGRIAHSHPGISMAELIEKICDKEVADHDAKLAHKQRDTIRATLKPRVEQVENLPKDTLKKRVSLRAKDRKATWLRANGKCENCGSQYALEIDHKKPVAMGGSNEPRNLRLLCRSCNQRAAIMNLGVEKMSKFINRRT